MKKFTTLLKTGLLTLGLQLAVTSGTQAGGAALLELPLAGVTNENREQCVDLLERKLSAVLSGWSTARSKDVTLITTGSTTTVRLRLGRGHLSIADVERALQGSPFSLNPANLEYYGVTRLQLGKVADLSSLASSLATLEGNSFLVHAVTNEDGTSSITLSDKRRQDATLFTHQVITRHLAREGAQLISINWGISPEADSAVGDSLNFHCRPPYGARPATSDTLARRR